MALPTRDVWIMDWSRPSLCGGRLSHTLSVDFPSCSLTFRVRSKLNMVMSLWILMHLYTCSLRYRLFSCSSQHERLGISHQPLQHWLCIHHQPGYHSCDCGSFPCLGFRWPCYLGRSCYRWLCMCWNPLVLNQTITDFILVVCLSPY